MWSIHGLSPHSPIHFETFRNNARICPSPGLLSSQIKDSRVLCGVTSFSRFGFRVWRNGISRNHLISFKEYRAIQEAKEKKCSAMYGINHFLHAWWRLVAKNASFRRTGKNLLQWYPSFSRNHYSLTTLLSKWTSDILASQLMLVIFFSSDQWASSLQKCISTNANELVPVFSGEVSFNGGERLRIEAEVWFDKLIVCQAVCFKKLKYHPSKIFDVDR